MPPLSAPVQLFFSLSLLLTFIISLLQNKPRQQLTLKPDPISLKAGGMTLLLFGLVFGLGSWLHLDLLPSLPAFLGSFLLSVLLAQTALSSRLQGILLLAASVFFAPNLTQTTLPMALPGALWGLVAWKTTQRLSNPVVNHEYEDILPASLWLAGLMWIPLGVPEAQQAALTNLLLGSLGISQILSLVQCQACPLQGRFFLKPLLLATLGGVGTLILANNLLLLPHPAPWALLFAGGVILASLLNGCEDKAAKETSVPYIVILLAFIGLGTLVASRIFGAVGWIFLGVSMLSGLRGGPTTLATLFLLGRSLLQSFIVQYNPNVTGINLMHPYASAALFAGVMLLLLLPGLLQAAKGPIKKLLGFLGGGLLLTLLANYFLHAEATSSLLIATTVAALCTALALPLYDTQNRLADLSLQLLFPAHLILTALMSHGLLELGDTTDKTQKLTVLLVTGLLLLVVWALSQRKTLRRETV